MSGYLFSQWLAKTIPCKIFLYIILAQTILYMLHTKIKLSMTYYHVSTMFLKNIRFDHSSNQSEGSSNIMMSTLLQQALHNGQISHWPSAHHAPVPNVQQLCNLILSMVVSICCTLQKLRGTLYNCPLKYCGLDLPNYHFPLLF